MKKLIFLLFACIMFAFASCTQPQSYYDADQNQQVNPQASYGTYNGQQVVYVTDNRGEQYLMNLILFNQLFNSGGYNSVSNYYYNHSNDYSNIYPYSSGGFHYSRSYGGFYNSYHQSYISHRIYTPSSTIVHNSTVVRTSHYGNSYRPTTTVTSRYTQYHANGTQTYHTVKTTYHASGRVSTYHSSYHPSSGSYHSSYHSHR